MAEQQRLMGLLKEKRQAVISHAAGGDKPLLDPLAESGSGALHEPQAVYMSELIQKLNELFGGETTDQDQLVYVNHVIKGKLLESATLREQAANNTKEQFGNSPDLDAELSNAIIEALDAHTSISTQALNSATVRNGLKQILLTHARLWESLRGISRAPECVFRPTRAVIPA